METTTDLPNFDGFSRAEPFLMVRNANELHLEYVPILHAIHIFVKPIGWHEPKVLVLSIDPSILDDLYAHLTQEFEDVAEDRDVAMCMQYADGATPYEIVLAMDSRKAVRDADRYVVGLIESRKDVLPQDAESKLEKGDEEQ